MGEPAELLVRLQAERLRAEQQDALGLGAPIGRHSVVDLGRALGDGVENAVAGHDLARGVEVDLQAAAGEGGDAVGQHLRRDARAGQVLRPRRHHAPGDGVLGDGGGGESGRRGGSGGASDQS